MSKDGMVSVPAGVLLETAIDPRSPWPVGFDVTDQADQGAVQVVLEITRIDLAPSYEASVIIGTDRQGQRRAFHFVPQTRVRRLLPTDRTHTISELVARDREFPLQLQQEVLVAWKLHAPTRQRIAVRFTVFD